MNHVTDALTIEFTTSDGSLLLKADLAELYRGVLEVQPGNNDGMHKLARAYCAWLKGQYQREFAESQAYQMYVQVCAAWDTFKKKFDAQLMPDMPSASTLEASTIE